MNDPVVPLSLSRVAAGLAWLLTAGLIGATWIAFSVGHRELTNVLGFSACVASAIAATLNVRCYALRLSRLMRVAGGLTSPESLRVLHRVD